MLLALFVCFETANFTGFSWTRLRWLSNQELIDAAIRYNYPGIYSNVAELKADYSTFSPDVEYWTDLTGEAGDQFLNKFVGFKLFDVRLPDAVVVVASDGVARFSRSSPTIAPDRPVLGIVGTVQDGPPNYEAANEFSVRWVDGSEGSVFISGHCFAALSESQKPVLKITGSNKQDAIAIGDKYGYQLVAIPDIKSAAYASVKISEQEFKQSQTCDKAIRAAWPNVGGASWKR